MHRLNRSALMRRVPPIFVKVFALALWLSVSVSGQAPLANLSGDLLALLLGGSTQEGRVSARGDTVFTQQGAARDSLPVLRVLDGFVVVQASPSELVALRQVAGI